MPKLHMSDLLENWACLRACDRTLCISHPRVLQYWHRCYFLRVFALIPNRCKWRQMAILHAKNLYSNFLLSTQNEGCILSGLFSKVWMSKLRNFILQHRSSVSGECCQGAAVCPHPRPVAFHGRDDVSDTKHTTSRDNAAW